MSRPAIVVFGAAQPQGGAVARALLGDRDRRFAVRAVCGDSASGAARALADAGAAVAAVDLDELAGVRAALAGAQGAFCVTELAPGSPPEAELRRAQAMAEAAAREDVRHVVWSTCEDTRGYVRPGSGGMPVLEGGCNVPHFDVKGEANHAFTARGVPTTLLYPALDWDLLIRLGMRPRRRADGSRVFALPTADAKLPGIGANDIGACALAIFARGDELIGKSIGISGEHLTAAQIAEQLSLAIGERVAHTAIAPAEYRALGFAGAAGYANMFQFVHNFEQRYCAARRVACTRELSPRLQTFAGWLAENRTRVRAAVPTFDCGTETMR